MSITNNKKAFHDFFIEEKYEAGIVLEGWEVKAIRADRVQIKESYVVVKNGEIWLLGRHRLICGDAREAGDYAALMDGKTADLVFTDPPYNVNYK